MAKEHVAYRVARVASFVGCLLATTTIASAQAVVPGVSVVPPPPAGFDPLTASPEARAKYAIPPPPDANITPEAYRRWERAVSAPVDSFAPVLKKTNIHHGPAKNVRPIIAQDLTQHRIETATTDNWSGSVVLDSNNPFNTATVIGEFVVPGGHLNFDGGGEGGISSIWAGIDGFSINNVGSGDVLQAGVDVNVVGTATPWVEWYPADPCYCVPLEIHPADLVWVQVWNTSSTKGYALFYNASTNKSAKLAVNAPKNTTLMGNTVEWIVERPSVNNKPILLNNYIDVPFTYGLAHKIPFPTHLGSNYLPGSDPPTGTLYQVEMLDDKGKGISSATIENSQFLYFQNYGSSSCKC
jgi:hypothetical protein